MTWTIQWSLLVSRVLQRRWIDLPSPQYPSHMESSVSE